MVMVGFEMETLGSLQQTGRFTKFSCSLTLKTVPVFYSQTFGHRFCYRII
jgi:hypothetical protein